MALEVPALEVTVGDCGLSGRGGGARSGSELSHLYFPEVSFFQNDIEKNNDEIMSVSSTRKAIKIEIATK